MKLFQGSLVYPFLLITAPSVDGSSSPVKSLEFQHGILRNLLQDVEHFSTLSSDFGGLNSKLNEIAIPIPNVHAKAGKVLGSEMTVDLRNIQCGSIAVRDIQVTSSKVTKQVEVTLKLDGFETVCSADWKYKFSFMSDSSKNAKLTSEDNSIYITLYFANKDNDFNESPPTTAIVKECVADVTVSNLDLNKNGIVGDVYDKFTTFFREKIANEIEKAACKELTSLGSKSLSSLLQRVQKTVEPYSNHKYDISLKENDYIKLENDIFEASEINNTSIFDYSSIQEIMPNWAHVGSKKLITMVEEMVDVDEISHEAKSDLRINEMIRSFLLNDKRSFVISQDVLPILYRSDTATVSLKNVEILGLDTFQTFKPFKKSKGKISFENSFSLQYVTIECDVVITTGNHHTLSSVDRNLQDKHEEENHLHLTMGVDDLMVSSMDLLIALDFNHLQNEKVGSFLLTEHILTCLLTFLFDARMSDLSVKVGNFRAPSFDCVDAEGILRSLCVSANILSGMYEKSLHRGITTFFQTDGLKFLSSALQKSFSTKYYGKECHDLGIFKGFVHFGDLLLTDKDAVLLGGQGTKPYGDALGSLMHLLKNYVLNASKDTNNLNSLLIDPLTKAQSNTVGTLRYPDVIFAKKGHLKIGHMKAAFSFSVSDALVEHLDTCRPPVKILDPVSSYIVNNSVAFGFGLDDYLRGLVQLELNIETNEGVYINNVFNVSLDLYRAKIELEALLKVRENEAINLPIKDLLNVNCWLSMIPVPELDEYGVMVNGDTINTAIINFFLSFSDILLDVKCVTCTSPKLEELSDLLSSPAGREDVKSLASMFLDYIEMLLSGRIIQSKIDQAVKDAPLNCPSNPSFDPNALSTTYNNYELDIPDFSSLDFVFTLFRVCAILSCIFAASVTIVKITAKKNHKGYLKSLCPTALSAVVERQSRINQREEILNSSTKSMFLSSSVPAFIRFLMPVLVLINIAFFLSGHLSLGATVNIVSNVAGQKFTINQLFEFSMAKSTLDLWDAGAKSLAVLLVIFSGIWPYSKQLIVLFLWFASPSQVSVSRREQCYIWLDVLGKWSMLDIFTLFMSVTAFRVSVQSPKDVTFLPEDFYAVDLMVVPLWGLYANMIAQLISQVSSHIMIHYHRKLVCEACIAANDPSTTKSTLSTEEHVACEDESNLDEPFLSLAEGELNIDPSKPSSKEWIPLRDHHFQRDLHKNGKYLCFRKWVNFAVYGVAIITMLLLIWGCSVPSFSLDIQGLFSLAVKVGQNFKSTVTKHSVFTMAKALIDQAKFLNTFWDVVGLSFLAFLLVSTVLLVPLAQVIVLMCRWSKITNNKSRFNLFVLNEILTSWQYVEVYILSLIVSVTQLGPVSAWMINPVCRSMKSTFSTLVFHGILDEKDAQCFRIQSQIENSTWLLFTAALLLSLLNTFIATANKDQDCFTHDILRVEKKELDQAYSHDAKLLSSIEKVRLRFTHSYSWLILPVSNNSDNTADSDQIVNIDEDNNSLLENGLPTS